jgi:hypothetical protein
MEYLRHCHLGNSRGQSDQRLWYALIPPCTQRYLTCTASLPTIRPACTYIFTCTHPRTRTGASSGSYPNSYGRSQTKQSIRLDTINKSTPNDESSSTHQLADSDDGGGRGSVSDFESHAIDRFRPAGNKYTSTVTGQSPGTGEFGANFGGILVKNETTVHVSKH